MAGAGVTSDLFSDWDETDNSADPEGIEVKIEVPEDGDYVDDIENSTNPGGGDIEVKTELTEEEDIVNEFENSIDPEGIVVKREVPENGYIVNENVNMVTNGLESLINYS